MKSPEQLAKKLAKQWENASLRESRLLGGEGWPILLSIGRPTPAQVRDDIREFLAHRKRWREVKVGKVIVKPIKYRSLGDQEIDVPTHWQIESASDWAVASGSSQVKLEYEALCRILRKTDSTFHSYFVRKRSSWRGQSVDEVIKVAELAMTLTPNVANGAPLRTISLAGIDSKFFERHRLQIIALLDLRYDGKVSALGLENFLGAWHDNEHWVLVSDLGNQLLTFSQQRVRSSELKQLSRVVTSRIVIVENEKCFQLLPKMKSTIVILGCGLDLTWMKEPWLQQREVYYWGDLDTWGLAMLAKARFAVPSLIPVMMTQDVFEQFADQKSVVEPTPASDSPPNDLTSQEKAFYSYLLQQKRGRLEQEFIPADFVEMSFLKVVCSALKP